MAAMPKLILVSIDGLAHFYWSDPLARMPVHNPDHSSVPG